MLSGDEFYDDEVTSGLDLEARSRLPYDGRDGDIEISQDEEDELIYGQARRCGHCGSPLEGDLAEVVAKGEEAVPIERHLLVHAEPCYTAHTDRYDLA